VGGGVVAPPLPFTLPCAATRTMEVFYYESKY